MKSSLRYQEGHLYEHHGAWYVRYRRKVRHEDGSSTWKRTARRLGRWCDFTNPFDVRRCRAELMLVVNRDWLSAYSRTTIAAFVDGVFLPWAREERRASTSHGYQAIWRTYLRDRVANIGLREFRTVDANGHWQRLRARGISRGTHSDESSRFLVPSLSTLRMWARLMEQIRLLGLLFRRMPETRKRLAPTISPKLHKCLRFCPSWQRPWSQLQLLLDFATASCAACIGPITRAIDSRSDARCGTR
jgi:hypothetical protein